MTWALAAVLGTVLAAPMPARADWAATLFFALCKRVQVEVFEPSTGNTWTREKLVCGLSGGGD